MPYWIYSTHEGKTGAQAGPLDTKEEVAEALISKTFEGLDNVIIVEYPIVDIMTSDEWLKDRFF